MGMINKKLHEIHAIMIIGFDEIKVHNWSKTFKIAKRYAIFETEFHRNGFDFSVKVTAEESK